MNKGINKVLAENLLNGQVTKQGAVKMSPGTLLDVALYVAENILPKIELRNHGKQTHDYKQMYLAVNACMMCCELMQEIDSLKNELHIKKQLLKFMQQENKNLEDQLRKFTTVQDLVSMETMEMYIDIVNGKKITELAEIIKQHQSRNKQL